MATSLKEDLRQVRDAIIDLYLDVKVRSNDEVKPSILRLQLNALNDSVLQDERLKLKSVGTKVIVDYIRSSIEILLNLKMEDSNLHNQSSKDDISMNTSHQTSKIFQKSKLIFHKVFRAR